MQSAFEMPAESGMAFESMKQGMTFGVEKNATATLDSSAAGGKKKKKKSKKSRESKDEQAPSIETYDTIGTMALTDISSENQRRKHKKSKKKSKKKSTREGKSAAGEHSGERSSLEASGNANLGLNKAEKAPSDSGLLASALPHNNEQDVADGNDSINSTESSIFSSYPQEKAPEEQVIQHRGGGRRGSILDDADSFVGGMVGKSDDFSVKDDDTWNLAPSRHAVGLTEKMSPVVAAPPMMLQVPARKMRNASNQQQQQHNAQQQQHPESQRARNQPPSEYQQQQQQQRVKNSSQQQQRPLHGYVQRQPQHQHDSTISGSFSAVSARTKSSGESTPLTTNQRHQRQNRQFPQNPDGIPQQDALRSSSPPRRPPASRSRNDRPAPTVVVEDFSPSMMSIAPMASGGGGAGDASVASQTSTSTQEMLVGYLRSMGTSMRTAVNIATTFRDQQNGAAATPSSRTTRSNNSSSRSSAMRRSSTGSRTSNTPGDSSRSRASQGDISGESRPSNARGDSGSGRNRPRGQRASPNAQRSSGASRATRRSSGTSRASSNGASGTDRGRRRPGRAAMMWERAMRPGAVQMEGRAFGAPRRPSLPEVDGNALARDAAAAAAALEGEETEALGAHLVEATAVKTSTPVVYAESTPLSFRDLLNEKPIRRRLLVLCFIVVTVVVLSVSLAIVRGDEGSGANSSSLAGYTSPPSLAPSTSPTFISAEILDAAIALSGAEAFNATDSPQQMAVGWLSTFDALTDGFGDVFKQRYTLATLFYSLQGSSWLEQENWMAPNEHECDWSGAIFCKNDVTGRRLLVGLDLTRNGLVGSLPEELGLTSHLDFLRLSKNRIQGSLPSALFTLPNLAVLDVNTNELTGRIPETMGVENDLVLMDISWNMISGSIPSGFTNLNLLRIANMHHNQLSGTLSTELANLKVISKLSVASNLLTGPIPPLFEDGLPGFDIIELTDNLLTGTIPSWILALLTRQELLMGSNFFTGTIPDVTQSPGLSLLLADPDSLESIRLKKVDLSNNDLIGSLPAWAGFLPSLKYIDGSDNHFTGTIPFGLFWQKTLWDGLETLKIANNELTGTLPVEIPPNLREVDLAGNQLEGDIPEVWRDSPSLLFMTLDNNEKLGGDVSISLANVRYLKTLSMVNTNLHGELNGTDFQSLANMEIIDLSQNAISGSIPTQYGDLRSLTKISLNSNQLSAAIPSELGKIDDLIFLKLANNNLSGMIPSELGNLQSLEEFTLIGNPQLGGTIPRELCDIAVNIKRQAVGCQVGCTCCMDETDLCSPQGETAFVRNSTSANVFNQKGSLRG